MAMAWRNVTHHTKHDAKEGSRLCSSTTTSFTVRRCYKVKKEHMHTQASLNTSDGKLTQGRCTHKDHAC